VAAVLLPLVAWLRFFAAAPADWSGQIFPRWMMTFVPAMWAVWGVLVLFFIGVKLYISRLSRDEDDQLVLQESFEHLKVEQAAIIARVNKVQPVQRLVMWTLAAMTLFVVGYYVLDMVRQFK
jgi:hypothetical protein